MCVLKVMAKWKIPSCLFGWTLAEKEWVLLLCQGAAMRDTGEWWWARLPRGYGHTQIFVAFSLWVCVCVWERGGVSISFTLPTASHSRPAAYITSTAGVPQKTVRKKKCQRANRERCPVSQTLRNVASCVRFPNKHRSGALSSLPRGTAQHSFTCSPPTAASAQQASHHSGSSVSLMRHLFFIVALLFNASLVSSRLFLALFI